ncbi:ACP S-malonyltransferase [Sulfurivermis fontis]|uniref:ACP S-malonyltransferase n=1 Tax=Sulfurivermis fontis TaxID=1972068 RepID=UPI000FD82AD0|nr:ACP S-malonyltransferase [Sulfurivermis fontis]
MSLAFVFPGQGSQSVGMLAELAAAHPLVRDTFAEASAALGYDLWQLTQNGPADELNQTHITQPAMLTAGVATWRVWQEMNGKTPVVMAGHSLGEYTALVCAGALSFADGVALVAERGRYMQEAVPAGTGAMAAILGLEDAQVVEACAGAAQGQVVSAVNFNSPGQVVIAGHAAAVERAMEAAKAMGAKRALPLPVSVPSHCALMQPAAERLAQRLAGISVQLPQIPVINNVDVAVASDADTMRQALARQLYSPVRWVETVQKMAADGVDALVECGPGKVLVGLNKRIAKDMKTFAIVDTASLDEALAALS